MEKLDQVYNLNKTDQLDIDLAFFGLLIESI